jgi:hypothetical protein
LRSGSQTRELLATIRRVFFAAHQVSLDQPIDEPGHAAEGDAQRLGDLPHGLRLAGRPEHEERLQLPDRDVELDDLVRAAQSLLGD